MDVFDINFSKIILSLMILVIVVFGSLINWFEPHLPVIFSQAFRYGKFAYKGAPPKFLVIEIPKSTFKHFYVFSSVLSAYALYVVINVYVFEASPSELLISYLDLICGKSRKAECGSVAVIIALLLFTAQCFKRFYETWFVSVFSKSKINIAHYLAGYVHYWITTTVILAEASGFKAGIPKVNTGLNLYQALAVIMFCIGWFGQFHSAKILGNLRKNSDGHIVTTEHKVPVGGLFEYLSSPHISCEVLMYLSLYMLLSFNENFKYVFLWVLSNQIESSLLSHNWYLSNFKNYPKERKVLIPFIY